MVTFLIITGTLGLIGGIVWSVRFLSSGYEGGWLWGTMFWVFGLIWFFAFVGSIHWKASNEVVSGIVYNTKNDKLISGNTTFAVRASVDTYTNTENASRYCLPPNSKYKELVNKAAMDKTIKVVVTENKAFKFMAPWECLDNVTVTMENK